MPGEFLQPVEKEIKNTTQMTRYKALETMEREDYNPVKKLIRLAEYLEESDLRDPDLEFKIHSKLLEYFSATPKKQMELDVKGHSNIVVMPVSYAHLYEGKDLQPHKPKLIDIIPEKTALEELMGDEYDPSTSYPGS